MMSGQDIPKPVVFLSPRDFTVERVFPIRHAVGDTEDLATDEPTPPRKDAALLESMVVVGSVVAGVVEDTTGPSNVEAVGESEPMSSPHTTTTVPRGQTTRRRSSTASDLSFSSTSDGRGGRRMTERFTMVTSASGPPGLTPGLVSENAKPTFYKCEDEPIHTPGAIQQYGALVALRYSIKGNLQVRIASENTQALLGYDPDQLFELQSFFDILNTETQEDMLARISHALLTADTPKWPEDTQLDVFTISLAAVDGSEKQLWCAMHISQGTQDLVICEFEAHSDVVYLEELSPNKTLPKTPTQTIDLAIHPEERIRSTTRNSAPLRVVEIARRKRQSSVSSMDIFGAMTQAQHQLAAAKSVQHLLDIVVGLISELTGFHRVMFYRFDSQKNGCVEAELVDVQASDDLFRGEAHPKFHARCEY